MRTFPQIPFKNRLKIRCFLFKLFHPFKTFTFLNKKYKYFHHYINVTWRNERSVEIPIIWELVNQFQSKNILEVGNVLSNYYDVHHFILDKYDRTKGIIKQDAIDYQPKQKFDLIVSISTLEHVGWDETPKDHQKAIKAINHLKKLLTPKGKMVVTLPISYHPEIDKLVTQKKKVFTHQYYLKRIGKYVWRQATKKEVSRTQYNHPYCNANGLIIGIFRKK